MIAHRFPKAMAGIGLAAIMTLSGCATPTDPNAGISQFVIFFDKNSTDVAKAEIVLASIADAQKKNVHSLVTITGFSDRGERARTDAQRAETVRNRLVALGVPAAAITVSAAGNTAEIVISGKVLREANYRAEVKIGK